MDTMSDLLSQLHLSLATNNSVCFIDKGALKLATTLIEQNCCGYLIGQIIMGDTPPEDGGVWRPVAWQKLRAENDAVRRDS